MKQYFRWHQFQRVTNLNRQNWRKLDYLVVRCMKIDMKCGDLSVRLKPLPTLLLIAYQSRRLLLIVWEKPAPLEQFLLPPRGGLDWRAPHWLIPHVAYSMYARGSLKTILHTFDTNVTTNHLKIVNVKYQEEELAGVDYFNEWQSTMAEVGTEVVANFQEVYHDVWRVLFTPVPPIAKAVRDFLATKHLVPGQYVGIHVAALQLAQQKAMGRMKQWTENSIRCASALIQQSTGPTYLAIDYPMARSIAANHAGLHHISLVWRPGKKAPLPLEQPYGQAYKQPFEYYESFIDLYVLGLSKCVAYHTVGHGHLGNLVSFNASCGILHQNQKGTLFCNWTLPQFKVVASERHSKTIYLSQGPLFLEPMEESLSVDSGMSEVEGTTATEEQEEATMLYTISQRMFDQPKELPSYRRQSLSPYQPPELGVDVGNSTLPKWMKEYFEWHREQRKLLNKTNVMNFKFLISHCLKIDARCGGTADRLKPLPLFLLVAYKTKRIFMIKWQKPKYLEAFLLPPVGGLDWRLPDYIFPHIAESYWPAVSLSMIEDQMNNNTEEPFMTVRFQSHSAGAEYFDANRPYGPTFAEVYHELWRMVFTPVPPIQRIIEDKMEEQGLIPGNYAAAHVRALYGIEERELFYIRDWTFNALNCASMLFPGAPIFFASDSSIAVTFAEYYGELKNSSIAVRKHDNPPLHVDKTSKWRGRKASDYYDTFVDLYLVGMSRCVTYNM